MAQARGRPVNEYDPILEVNTDKVDTEIPSPAAGVLLKVLVPEGTTVKAGTVLALIGEPGDEPRDEPADGHAPAESAMPATTDAEPVMHPVGEPFRPGPERPAPTRPV